MQICIRTSSSWFVCFCYYFMHFFLCRSKRIMIKLLHLPKDMSFGIFGSRKRFLLFIKQLKSHLARWISGLVSAFYGPSIDSCPLIIFSRAIYFLLLLFIIPHPLLHVSIWLTLSNVFYLLSWPLFPDPSSTSTSRHHQRMWSLPDWLTD